jgi:hypothetical protein
MNLISMSDFVVEMRKNKKKDNGLRFWACEKYVKFLKQPLELWMFVPCDEDGNVLEEPELYNEVCEYQKAKERCFFEGFEYKKALFFTENKELFWHGKLHGNVESLTKYNLKLTQTAIKQLGL